MFLNALPTLSPANIMAKIKGVTSKKLREETTHQMQQRKDQSWIKQYC